jgi:hypothetical protein
MIIRKMEFWLVIFATFSQCHFARASGDSPPGFFRNSDFKFKDQIDVFRASNNTKKPVPKGILVDLEKNHSVVEGSGTIFKLKEYSEGKPNVMDDEAYNELTIWVAKPAAARFDLAKPKEAKAYFTRRSAVWTKLICGGAAAEGAIDVSKMGADEIDATINVKLRCWILNGNEPAYEDVSFTKSVTFKNEGKVFCANNPDAIVSKYLDEIWAKTDKKIKDDMKAASFDGLIKYHHGYGTWIRNNWLMGKHPKQDLLNYYSVKGFNHKDDVSMDLIQHLWCRARPK